MATTRKALPRRGVDRLADALAVLTVVAAFALLLAAGAAVVVVHGKESQRVAAEQQERTRVGAVLLADATREGTPASATAATPVRVAARWTDPDGTPVTGEVFAPFGADAGQQVNGWVDGNGQPVTAPADQDEVFASTILTGFSVMALGGMLLLGAGLGVEQLLALARGRYWEREWDRVEPMWRHGRAGQS
ncbi:Rv1733c family protein [Pseudonocardia lacus]|uniref:Rv1733c family protein n=1 Tax=Pseudonocardia lacus TaxID=2835865 RepID=UPI001BDC0E17|nr:hypothetical protein [Pseudonocardia lacus]